LTRPAGPVVQMDSREMAAAVSRGDPQAPGAAPAPLALLAAASCVGALLLLGHLLARGREILRTGPSRPLLQPLLPLPLARPTPPMAMAMAAATVDPAATTVEAAPGVSYDTLAREWRCKWESEGALSLCQKVLDKYTAQLQAVPGLEVQRTVCGGCKDFKVVISHGLAPFAEWKAGGFGPEAAVLADLRLVPGVKDVEAQTYSWQTLQPPAVPDGKMQELVPGVQFNRIAREWRCKWSDANSLASLVEAQQVLTELLPLLRSLPGAQVQRVVCGGCKDLKVITSVPAAVFEAWKERRFKPEENFLNEVTSIRGISQVEVQTYTLQSLTGPPVGDSGPLTEKAKGILFNRAAREWRCKWSKADDSASLVAAQKVLDKHLPTLKALEGVEVQRVVCGGCLDFKVIISLPAAGRGAWKDTGYAPEEAFLEELRAIPGITQVETQTYTLQPLDGTVPDPPMQEKAPGIAFNRVAREWRCRFGDKTALAAAQKVLDLYLPVLTARNGARVQRAACLDLNQLKVVTSVPSSEFPGWKDEEFPPEEDFLAAWSRISGIRDVETQTYTFQTL